ncbi:transcription initiation factor IIB [Rhizophlyctis rosea]|nr:transcription initiation factor IIB [Rhizophlyctis rosea]
MNVMGFTLETPTPAIIGFIKKNAHGNTHLNKMGVYALTLNLLDRPYGNKSSRCQMPTEIVERFAEGDMLCGECKKRGLAPRDRIIDTRSEPRTFADSEDGGVDSSHVGAVRNSSPRTNHLEAHAMHARKALIEQLLPHIPAEATEILYNAGYETLDAIRQLNVNLADPNNDIAAAEDYTRRKIPSDAMKQLVQYVHMHSIPIRTLEDRRRDSIEKSKLHRTMIQYQNRELSVAPLLNDGKSNFGNQLLITDAYDPDLDRDINQLVHPFTTETFTLPTTTTCARWMTVEGIPTANATFRADIAKKSSKMVERAFEEKGIVRDLRFHAEQHFVLDIIVNMGDDEPVGALQYAFLKGYIWLDSVTVEKKWEGIGIEWVLLERIIDVAKNRQKNILLHTSPGGVQFFEHLGFRVEPKYTPRSGIPGNFMVYDPRNPRHINNNIQGQRQPNRLAQALKTISTVSSRLKLDQTVTQSAKELLKRVIDEGGVAEDQVDAILGACIYIASRRYGYHLSFGEVARASRKIGRREIGSAFESVRLSEAKGREDGLGLECDVDREVLSSPPDSPLPMNDDDDPDANGLPRKIAPTRKRLTAKQKAMIPFQDFRKHETIKIKLENPEMYYDDVQREVGKRWRSSTDNPKNPARYQPAEVVEEAAPKPVVEYWTASYIPDYKIPATPPPQHPNKSHRTRNPAAAPATKAVSDKHQREGYHASDRSAVAGKAVRSLNNKPAQNPATKTGAAAEIKAAASKTTHMIPPVIPRPAATTARTKLLALKAQGLVAKEEPVFRPTYRSMIRLALEDLNDAAGSTRAEIAKWNAAKYKRDDIADGVRETIRVGLKRGEYVYGNDDRLFLGEVTTPPNRLEKYNQFVAMEMNRIKIEHPDLAPSMVWKMAVSNWREAKNSADSDDGASAVSDEDDEKDMALSPQQKTKFSGSAPEMGSRPYRKIADRESEYHARRLNRQLSPDRVDAFSGKPVNAEAQALMEFLREQGTGRDEGGAGTGRAGLGVVEGGRSRRKSLDVVVEIPVWEGCDFGLGGGGVVGGVDRGMEGMRRLRRPLR